MSSSPKDARELHLASELESRNRVLTLHAQSFKGRPKQVDGSSHKELLQREHASRRQLLDLHLVHSSSIKLPSQRGVSFAMGEPDVLAKSKGNGKPLDRHIPARGVRVAPIMGKDFEAWEDSEPILGMADITEPAVVGPHRDNARRPFTPPSTHSLIMGESYGIGGLGQLRNPLFGSSGMARETFSSGISYGDFNSDDEDEESFTTELPAPTHAYPQQNENKWDTDEYASDRDDDHKVLPNNKILDILEDSACRAQQAKDAREWRAPKLPSLQVHSKTDVKAPDSLQSASQVDKNSIHSPQSVANKSSTSAGEYSDDARPAHKHTDDNIKATVAFDTGRHQSHGYENSKSHSGDSQIVASKNGLQTHPAGQEHGGSIGSSRRYTSGNAMRSEGSESNVKDLLATDIRDRIKVGKKVGTEGGTETSSQDMHATKIDGLGGCWHIWRHIFRRKNAHTHMKGHPNSSLSMHTSTTRHTEGESVKLSHGKHNEVRKKSHTDHSIQDDHSDKVQQGDVQSALNKGLSVQKDVQDVQPSAGSGSVLDMGMRLQADDDDDDVCGDTLPHQDSGDTQISRVMAYDETLHISHKVRVGREGTDIERSRVMEGTDNASASHKDSIGREGTDIERSRVMGDDETLYTSHKDRVGREGTNIERSRVMEGTDGDERPESKADDIPRDMMMHESRDMMMHESRDSAGPAGGVVGSGAGPSVLSARAQHSGRDTREVVAQFYARLFGLDGIDKGILEGGSVGQLPAQFDQEEWQRAHTPG